MAGRFLLLGHSHGHWASSLMAGGLGGLWPPAEPTRIVSGQLALKGASRSALLGLMLGAGTRGVEDVVWRERFLGVSASLICPHTLA